jgi:hypothetical protein
MVAQSKMCGLGLLEQWECGFESHLRYGCRSAFLCIVLSCIARGILLECQKGFIVSEVTFEAEQARGPNLQDVEYHHHHHHQQQQQQPQLLPSLENLTL